MKTTETMRSTGARALGWLAAGAAFCAGLVLLAADVREGAPHWVAAFVICKAAGLALLGLAALACRRAGLDNDGEEQA